MNELKKLLVCALGVTVIFGFGCDVEEECNEAGVCADGGSGEGGAGGGAGGAGGGAGGAGGGGDITYDTVLIFDQDSMDDGAGTSGVDICGVSADCANATAATPVLGGGELCREEGPGCSTSRVDPQAALDDGSDCEADSNPSHYISLGTSGSLAVTFDGDLAGCNVTIVEFAGATEEGWEAFVCDGDDVTTANCLGGGNAVHTEAAGGTATFAVPAE
jgi:hypothetical protein